MIEILIKVNPFIRLGLIASILYILSCETKGTISKVLRYISLLFPIICLPFHFTSYSLCFCLLVTLGEVALHNEMISTGIAVFLYGYAVLCCHYIDLPFNVIYNIVCFFITTFVLFQKDIRVMVSAYSICVVVPLIICIMINHSVVCALLLAGDVLLGINYLKHNKLIMYLSQTCFYIGSCMALGIL